MFRAKNLLGGMPFGTQFYQTTDAPEEVLAPGYFDKAYDHFKRLDRLTVHCVADEREPQFGDLVVLELIVNGRWFDFGTRTAHVTVVQVSRTAVPKVHPDHQFDTFLGDDPGPALQALARQADRDRPRH